MFPNKNALNKHGQAINRPLPSTRLQGIMPEKFSTLDFEYQTYQTAQGNQPKIYEIGCQLNTGETYHTLIYGPEVTENDRALTGITQQSLEEEGVPASIAFQELLAFNKKVPIFIWGFSDVTLLSMGLWREHIPFPNVEFYETRSYLEGLTGIKLPKGLTQACKYLQLTRTDSHGALVDAVDTMRLIKAVAGLKETQPPEEACVIVEV